MTCEEGGLSSSEKVSLEVAISGKTTTLDDDCLATYKQMYYQ